MGKITFDDTYKRRQIENTEEWLKNNGCCINGNTRFTCPRCGLTFFINKSKTRKSKFGYEICGVCHKQEELGFVTDTKNWFIFSQRNR